jgi:alpha-beta hydrolase superfamily lysophospholipase
VICGERQRAGNGRTRQILPWLVGAAAVGIGAALPAGLAWIFLHPPRRLHRANPLSAFGFGYERVRFRAADGVRLRGWFVPAPAGQPARGIVVICHGYYGNRETMLPYLGFLHRAGYAAFLFDFRAHGWSGGRMAGFGTRELYDLLAAVDWVKEREETKNLPLAVLGESMGASISLLVAAQDERIQAVVADSPYARFDAAVDGRLRLALGPAASLVSPQTKRVGEFLLGVRCEEIAPVESIARIAPRPVFLIHGLDDRLLPPENSRRIHEAASGNTTLWEVPGARHVRSVFVAGEEYARRVVAVLDTAFASSGAA